MAIVVKGGGAIRLRVNCLLGMYGIQEVLGALMVLGEDDEIWVRCRAGKQDEQGG